MFLFGNNFKSNNNNIIENISTWNGVIWWSHSLHFDFEKFKFNSLKYRVAYFTNITSLILCINNLLGCDDDPSVWFSSLFVVWKKAAGYMKLIDLLLLLLILHCFVFANWIKLIRVIVDFYMIRMYT